MSYTKLYNVKQFGHSEEQKVWMNNERRATLMLAAVMKEYCINRLVLSPKTCREISNHYMNRWTLSIRATPDGGLGVEYKDESGESNSER